METGSQLKASEGERDRASLCSSAGRADQLMADGRRSSAVDGDEVGGGADSGGGGGGAVELSLRLRVGSSSGGGSAPEATTTAARWGRSMTIFYGGRVCAVDVTALQAMAIIATASQQLQGRDHRDAHRESSSSTSSTGSAPQPKTPAATSARRQAAAAAAAAARISHPSAAGLSMKRSLQRFLQKRKTRAAAAGSPYAGGRAARPTSHPPMHS